MASGRSCSYSILKVPNPVKRFWYCRITVYSFTVNGVYLLQQVQCSYSWKSQQIVVEISDNKDGLNTGTLFPVKLNSCLSNEVKWHMVWSTE